MSREAWNLIKHSKRFYVSTFRRAGTALIFSVLVNVSLGAALCFVYINQPEHDFYATNGITPPEELTPMDVPNNTSAALLANDPDSGNETKIIPQ